MLLSYMVNTPDVAPDNVLGATGDVAANLAMLADMGYGAVELQVRDPAALDRATLEAAVAASGLSVCCLCTGEIPGQDGLSLTDPSPIVREAAEARLRQVIDLAGIWECCVNIGRFRGGYVEGVPDSRTRTWGLEAFGRAADYAEQRRVTLVLEPIAAEHCNWINTTREGISAYLKVSHPAFALMLDTAHIRAEGETPVAALRDARDRVAHVHICDDGRSAPGEGSEDFRALVETLHGIGYGGALSAELRADDHRLAAERTARHMLPLPVGIAGGDDA